jgi:hypothetical protein
MLKNLIYAILLGAGMAACLADNNNTAVTDAPDKAAIPDATVPDTQTEAQPTDFVLEKGRAGAIRIGMPIDELRQMQFIGQQLRDTTLQLEGQAYTAYTLHTTAGEPGLLIEQQCEPDCQVWRIRVLGNDYKTAQGLGVGAKYGEVAQQFRISYASLGDAGFVAVSEQAGMSFILNTSTLDSRKLHQLKPDQIPANTLVRSILLY